MRTEAAAPHFVGLDIGTSTVRCVIGTRDEHTGVISVIGHGSAPNQGMRKGVIMHVDDSACNLASINLMKFRREDGSFDVDGFCAVVDTVFLAQEIIVSPSS